MHLVIAGAMIQFRFSTMNLLKMICQTVAIHSATCPFSVSRSYCQALSVMIPTYLFCIPAIFVRLFAYNPENDYLCI